ncbi:unnamed protein product [Prunus armeniaca]
MSQGDVTRHEGAGGNTKLACRKARWLGTRARGCRRQHQACVSQGKVARHEGTRVPEATPSLRVARQGGWARGYRRGHKAYVSQGDVTRHEGAGGNTKIALKDDVVPKGTEEGENDRSLLCQFPQTAPNC